MDEGNPAYQFACQSHGGQAQSSVFRPGIKTIVLVFLERENFPKRIENYLAY